MQTLSEQPLIEHLVELRRRLIICLISLGLGFICLYPFRNQLYAYFSEPLRRLLPAGSQMIAVDITSPFMAPLKLTFAAAFCLTMPIILFQVWRFIAPGLYSHEKKYGFLALITSILLFYLGLLFCYFVALPLLFSFFTSIGPSEIAMMTDINAYLNFVLSLEIIFGLIFQIPIFTVLTIKTGLVDIASLQKSRPYIIVGAFVIGMLITPPDVFSQSLVAIPMWLLFELGLFLSRWLRNA